jgi:putative membrane protein insertion efficiency factor
MTRILLILVAFYRLCLSPFTPPTCRFVPTCSAYAEESLVVWGWRRGVVLTLIRFLKCHPWHPGGFDPVPPRNQQ